MQESLSQKTLKNTAYNFLNFVWPIVFSIFVTPIVVYKLGVSDYGLYVIVITLISFLSLLDLGFTSSFMRLIAQADAQGDRQKLQRVTGIYFFINIVIGLIGLAIVLGLLPFAGRIFKLSPAYFQHVKIIFVLAGFTFFANTVSNTYFWFFRAMQRYDIDLKINFISSTALNLLILVAVLAGFRLKVIMGLYVLNAVATFLFNSFYIRRAFKNLIIRPIADIKAVIGASKFGLVMFANSLAGTSLLQLDKLVLGGLAGPIAVSYYALPGNVAIKILNVSNSFSAVLFPVMSGLSAGDNKDRIRAVYRRSIRNTIILTSAMAVPAFIFAGPILHFWLKGDFAQKSTNILRWLIATYFLLAIYAPVSSYLAGVAKLKLLTAASVSLAVLNIGLMVFLIPKYGALGAAIAYLFSVLLVVPVMVYIEKCHFAIVGSLVFYFKLAAKLLLVSFLVLVVSHFILLPLARNLYCLLIVGPLAVALFLLLYKVFKFFEPEDEEMISQFVANGFQKFRRVFARVD